MTDEAKPRALILTEHLGSLARASLGGFVKTLIGSAVLATITGAIAYGLAAQGSVGRGLGAAALALVAVLAGGWTVAMKRAIGGALIEGAERLALGKKALELVFDRLLGVSEEGLIGERGSAIARSLEKLPLAEAERKLDDTITGLLAIEPGDEGLKARILRKVRALLLRRVQALTLARFREENATSGGVDLVRARDALGGTIDGLLTDQIRSALARTTMLVLGGAVAASVLVAWLLPRI